MVENRGEFLVLRYLFHRLHKKQPVKAAVVIISIYIVNECQADPLERFVEPVRSLRYSPPRAVQKGGAFIFNCFDMFR